LIRPDDVRKMLAPMVERGNGNKEL
jgi:hypothetical protein